MWISIPSWTCWGKMGVDSVLLEGGATLHWAAVRGLVDKVQAYIAPKILGGQGPSPRWGPGLPHPDQALQLKNPVLTRLGPDFLLESEVAK